MKRWTNCFVCFPHKVFRRPNYGKSFNWTKDCTKDHYFLNNVFGCNICFPCFYTHPILISWRWRVSAMLRVGCTNLKQIWFSYRRFQAQVLKPPRRREIIAFVFFPQHTNFLHAQRSACHVFNHNTHNMFRFYHAKP